jgi:uncharacterized protein DUF6869
MTVRKPNVDRLARDYFTPWVLNDDKVAQEADPAFKRSTAAFGRISELIWRDPEAAWEILLELLDRAPTDDARDRLAAGPLEDFVRDHGAAFLDRIDEQAAKDPRFREALTQMWVWPSVPATVRDRLLPHFPDELREKWASIGQRGAELRTPGAKAHV